MGWQAFPIKYGHAPDLDPTSPDAWEIIGALPYENGIGVSYYFSGAVTSAQSQVPVGAAELFDTSGVRSVFVGTSSNIYEWDSTSGGTATDVSGTAYSAADWSFAQFGDNTLAATINHRIHRYTGTGTFSPAASNAPKASIIVNVGFPAAPQIMAFDYDDGTRYKDGWYCSALSSDTSWTVSYASGCANGRMLEPTGPFTAAIAFRDGVVAFKDNAMYYGEYSPDGVNVWQWRRLSSSIGCVGKHALCNAEDVIYFADKRGFYSFDGSYPQRVPGYVHEEWSRKYINSLQLVKQYITCHYDSEWSIVQWDWATTTANATGDGDGYAYNIRSRQWTMTRRSLYQGAADAAAPVLKAGFRYGISGGTNYDCLVMNLTNERPAQITSPKLGGGLGVTISGVWPVWQSGTSGNYYGEALGPPAGQVWSGSDGASTPLLAFYAHNAPQLQTPATTVTGIADNQIGRGMGSVTGRWASVRFAVGQGYPYRISSVMLDVRYGPRTP